MSHNDTPVPLPDLNATDAPTLDDLSTSPEDDTGSRIAADLEAVFDVPVQVSAVLGRSKMDVADLLKLLLKIRARDADVAPRLIARSEELELLAAGKRDGLSILAGWRFEQFGRDALDLVEGRLAFAVKQGKLCMTRTGREPA